MARQRRTQTTLEGRDVMMLKFATAGAPRPVADRTFRFVASSSAVDREGDVIPVSAWQLENFLKNPVILFGHDYRSLPVARAARIWTEGNSLLVDVEFPEEGVSDFSDQVHGQVAAGLLSAVSVGFIALASVF